MPRRFPVFLFFCWAAAFPQLHAGAAIIYVDSGAQGPVHDGTSWCNAFVHVQDALDVASFSDVVRVAEGTYRPDQGVGWIVGDRSASFWLSAGVTLSGGFAGCGAPNSDERDVMLHKTVLSGDLNEDDQPNLMHNEENSYHVLRAEFFSSAATLDGFVIFGGNANGADPANRGGGLRVANAHVTMRDCTFERNAGRFGGAVNCDGGGLSILNTVFEENVAGYSGGAIRVWNGSLNVGNCLFHANVADAGAGAWIGASATSFRNCSFSENIAPSGKALAFDSCCPQQPSGFEAVNCILWDGGGEIANNDGSSVSVGFSVVAGGNTGQGNIIDDPLFVPGPAGCHYLSHSAAGNSQDSPAVDAGADAAGNPRTTRLDELGDAGVTDVGYHYPITGRTLIMGDADRSTKVDLRDAASLQICFTGENPGEVLPPCRIFDFEEDADVDVVDAEAFVDALTGP